MNKTDLREKSIDTVHGLVLDYIADPNNVRKRIGIYAFMEDVLTEVHDQALEAAHRIEVLVNCPVYTHHPKCQGACDYGCNGTHDNSYPEAIRRLRIKE